MKVQEALDSIHEEYGLYNQVEVVDASEFGVTFVPKQDSVYGQADIDFLETKFNQLIKE